MPRLAGCPQDQGVTYGYLDPIAIVLHRTYGQWPGDYSVIKNNGLCQFLIGKDEGQWVQFADTNQVTYHCNGANFKAVGIELTGVNEDPLTPWQEARLGDVLNFLHVAHGIPLDYTDPNTVAPASVWVNGGLFRGVISHDSVRTDDGSSQHTDEVPILAYIGALFKPGPTPPEDDVKLSYIGKKSDPNAGIFVSDGVWKRHVTLEEWQFAKFVDPTVNFLPVSDEWWDSIPTAK